MVQGPGLSLSFTAFHPHYQKALLALEAMDFQRRLLAKDPSLWSGDPHAISGRLGWLSLPLTMAGRLDELRALAEEVEEAAFQHVVLLGMGGSSLAPEVMHTTFGPAPGYPSLTLLDTTDPATIATTERALDLEQALFIVSSKSGTTIETSSLYHYFAFRFPPNGENGSRDNFVAVTDPGTPLEKLARAERFRHVFVNGPDVGGRFSALSCFGLVPASAVGIDPERLLDSAAALDPRDGVHLGAALGGLALAGRDKVTFFTSPSLRGFGAWAEQLLAESTGKLGKGIIPVDLEPAGPPAVYGDDRLFVYLCLAGEQGPEAEIRALEAAGHPVITITLPDPYALGAEFLRWEIATAAVGVLLGINPFDEPNVTEAKERTAEILRETFRGERLPEPEPVLSADGIIVHVSETARPFVRLSAAGPLPALLLDRQLARPGDYYAVLAYIPRTAEHDGLLTRLRVALRDATRLATSVGYGPRYLHSTGQLFKGGPDRGVFIQLIAEDSVDLEVPGEEYTFGVLKRAQALGDLRALESRGRRVVRLDLGADAAGGLRRIVADLEAAGAARAKAGG